MHDAKDRQTQRHRSANSTGEGHTLTQCMKVNTENTQLGKIHYLFIDGK
jgi:hypothetical protein